MNLDSLSFALSQISYLVANLTKKSLKSSSQELSQLVSSYGLQADRHLLRCLFSCVDLSVEGSRNNNGPLQELLAQECSALLSKPSLISTLCYALDNPLHQQKTLKPSPQLLPLVSKVIKLTPVQEVVFGLALTHSSNLDTQNFAIQFVKQKLPELIRSYIDIDSSHGHLEGGLHDTTPEVLHLILSSVFFDSNNQFGIGVELKKEFLKNLRRDFKRELVPVVLAPFIYPNKPDLHMDSLNQDNSTMANTMQLSSLENMIAEMGYSFCSSVEECRNSLVSLGGREITPATIARIISMMARTHTGLSDPISIQGLQSQASFWGAGGEGSKDKGDPMHPTTWNVEVFVRTLRELVPTLPWNEVLNELDHPEFLLRDRNGLNLLMTAIRLGIQAHGFHPDMITIDFLYRRWKNSDGQFSLIQQILKNQDIFCIADHPFRPVATDILKAPPETDNKEIACWRSLDLVETLLYLAEMGPYNQVQELFKVPMQLCPDVLVLALLQASSPPVTVLRHELLTNLIPIFLGNHPNSAIILHHAWHSQTQTGSMKLIIMHAMAEWYNRGDNDQTRLSRILDVAQDLKALTMLLNMHQNHIFVIDLACLASRREYLKLEKWLTDKMREIGEQFVSACVKFLQRRCPQILGGLVKEDSIPKSAQLPTETSAVMLSCLHSYVNAGRVSQELGDAVLTLASHCSLLVNKSRQPPPGPGVLRSHSHTQRPGLEHPPHPPQQVFGSTQLSDQIATLSSSLASIGMGGMGPGALNVGPPSSSAFNLPGSLGPLVSTPGSPSRLLGPAGPTGPAGPAGPAGPGPAGPSQSPFPMILNSQLQQAGGPVGTQVGPTGTVSLAMAHLNAQHGADKARIGDPASLFPDMALNVSKEIEDEANSYFQRIYNHPPHPTLSIDEVLEMLKKFKESPNKREKEVFSCMLRNLFEEYRFFPQYPDKELHITAQLFGGIIDRNLVSSYMAMGLALRFVLDALRKPHGSKMYFFGIAALDRFKNRLFEYQKYCEHVSAIPHFNEFPPHLVEYVEYGLRSQEPPNQPTGPVLPASLAAILGPPLTTTFKTLTTTTVTTTTTTTKPAPTAGNLPSRPSIANATNIDTLLVATEKEDKITAPPEALQDKVAFVFNNLSQLNLQSKCDEIRDIVTEEYWPWISQYLVMKRASIELNFHGLYSNFLDTLKINQVYQMVLRETFRNIRVLLRSDKGIANFSDRSLLKNLGHWLGMLTLGRNRPILAVDIDIKSLLVEAYQKGQQELLYVVPFVAKVLESCAKSRAFKPPNPWTMAIMNVLAELHQEPALKLNLKFEIEVLCKNLNIDVSELKPSNLLKNPNLENMEYQLSHPKKKEQPGSAASLPSAPPTPAPLTSTSEEVSQVVIQSSAVMSNSTPNASTTPLGSVAIMAAPSVPPSSASPPSLPSGPPEPRFSYGDINISSISNIGRHITVNGNIPLFQAHPQLKQFVRPAIERAIQEWILPVVERSVKIAVTTSEQIIKKDFALDPDETRMRAAAHQMVRNLTAGMAMITCRDQLLLSIGANLKAAFSSALGAFPNQQHKELCDSCATMTAQDNMELACAFIQKTAIEKALPEIDKHLHADFERRRTARADGRRYVDPSALSLQAEHIRLKMGGVTPQQMGVYEEFARNIPGFMPLTERDAALFVSKPVSVSGQSIPAAAPAPIQPNYSDEIVPIYDKLVSEVELAVHSSISGTTSTSQLPNLRNLLEALLYARRLPRDPMHALTLVQKTVESLLDGVSQLANDPDANRYKEIHIRILKGLQNPLAYGVQWTMKQVTRYLTEAREDIRYNLEAVDCLVRSGLVNMQQYDMHVAQAMENGSNFLVVAFAMNMVQLYVIDERLSTGVTEADLCNTIEILARIAAHSRSPPEGLTSLIEVLRINHDPSFQVDRAPGGPTAHIHSGILQVRTREFDDPPGYVEKTEFLLREWVTINLSPTTGRDPTKAFSVFVQQMNVHGILKTDDLITRFFRISTQICVDICYRALNEQAGSASASPALVRAKCFRTLDAFVRLIALLVKHSGDSTNTGTKINLLNKVLGIVAGVLLQDHEVHLTEFQQLPYHRIFIMLFLELNAPEPILEQINFQVLTAFCHTLHILSPSKAPGFAYAWLELVSHRVFISRMLAVTPQQKGWGMYSQLLLDLFKFLAPFLRNAELGKPVTMLYKGTLRVLLVLLHDFPEFLCDYHYGFCDVIPPNCIQMRNLILSAFPRSMRLPDPFTPNLKVDMLPEIALAPRVLTNFTSMVQPLTFKKDLDSYLKARSPVTTLSELRSHLQISNEPGTAYNIPLMNALVLYVGTQAINFIRSKGLTPNMTTIAHSAHMDIFQNLAVDLDTEGRYLFLNAIANQLRYPNSHTHYFSCTLLYLFAEANSEAIQEQITRVLLERLIVNRPHPWGLLITFIELIKNPTYKFWNHEFVHCAPEIEKLFESVARSCMVQKQVQPQQENEVQE